MASMDKERYEKELREAELSKDYLKSKNKKDKDDYDTFVENIEKEERKSPGKINYEQANKEKKNDEKQKSSTELLNNIKSSPLKNPISVSNEAKYLIWHLLNQNACSNIINKK